MSSSAATSLVKMAAADGDWSNVASSLSEMDAESRFSALMAATAAIETPSGCSQLIALLGQALEDVSESGYSGIASFLQRCEKRPEAQELFLELLRRPARQVPAVSIDGSSA